jgi:cell fate (sporulation/competence/biofilm development) regulator YmcA (YheA/YmcA/DUF963 family)
MSRIINIILTDLASEIMKYEEAMETAINSKDDIEVKVETIKKYLAKVVETEKMIEKWKSYTQSVNNNNNQVND